MSGIGRGGRGLAMAEAMNSTLRQPGTADTTATDSAQAAIRAPMPGTGGVGRGNLLQQMMLLRAQQQQQPPLAVQQLPTVMPEPPRQIVQPTALGCGSGPMTAPSLSANVTPVTPVTPGPGAVAVGRGASLSAALSSQVGGQVRQPANIRAQSAQLPPAAAAAVPAHDAGLVRSAAQSREVAVHESVGGQGYEVGAGDGQGEGGRGGRESWLQHMVQGMRLNDESVVKMGSRGDPMHVTCNYIRLRSRIGAVYQYHVSYDPPVEHMGLRRRLLLQHQDIIGQTITFDGAILFLPKQLPEPEMFLKSYRENNNNDEVTVIVKLTKVLPPSACIQLFNVMFRKIMYILEMVQVGRNYYDPKHPESIPAHRLEVWPGYITAVEEQEGGLLLMADVSHRVLSTATVLDKIEDIMRRGGSREDVVRALLGTVVLTRYNNKTYRVDDILWDKSPADKFAWGRNGLEISYIEYYQKTYEKTIRQHGQPLLLNRPTKRDRNGQKVEGFICLIPELCYTTGLSDETRTNFTIMKALHEHTRVTPMQRHLALQKFIRNVNTTPDARKELDKWGLELDNGTVELAARRFEPEQVLFRNGKTVSAGLEADWGREIGRQPVITTVRLDNWVLIFFQRNSQEVQEFVNSLRQVAGPMGMEVAMPQVQELQRDRIEDYTGAIRSQLVNSQTQIVVAVFPTARDDRYSAVKKVCCVEKPVPSQMINSKTIKPGPKLRSVSQKVLLQMNCKLGGELWAVKVPSKTLMVVGIDVYHDGSTRTKRSVGAVVCSMNDQCTQWYSRAVYQTQGQELMDSLKVLFSDALLKYRERRGALPDRIIVFRDGVGDGQLKVVEDYEVPQMKDVFRHLGQVDYNPKLTVVIVGKRINTRIFNILNNGQLDNPPPGTVVDHTITRKHWFDFFIVSQHVRQGTVSPTHYIVVHDESGWMVDNIQQLTYKMTHLYYNWPGTVRVPAPCQNAHKLASLVGQHLHKEPDQLLANRLFYL